MERNILLEPFEKDAIPSWGCPCCKAGTLSLVEDSFFGKYADDIDTNHPHFEPEWVSLIFTMILKCANGNCNAHVACVGTGGAEQRYLDDGTGGWGWFTFYSPSHFEPPLRLFKIPSNTPDSVVESLDRSFAVFFRSPSTALSCLRTALETLLSELGVSARNVNGGYVPLAERIQLLSKEYQEIIEPVTAVKWLGNDGTHADSTARKSDVIDGYVIFEHVLDSIYPPVKADIGELVEKIIQAKGIA